MNVLETERLTLGHLSVDDAEFVFALVNDPSWLRYIGDKGVRNLDDARAYILNGPVKSYAANGFGLYRVGLKRSGIAIGINGLIKRDTLPDPDIGFAFLPQYRSQGYALESARAVMKQARETFALDRVLAITSPDNQSSEKLLGKIGFRFDRMLQLADDTPEVKLFTNDPDADS